MSIRQRELFSLLILLLAAPAIFAQRGCFHSPEAPTDVLLIVGGAGMFYGSALLRRLVGRKNKSRHGS